MKRRPKTALGIDVCRDRVSVALVSQDVHGFRLVRAASTPLPEGVPDAGSAEDIRVLSSVIRKLRRRAGIPAMSAVVGMSVDPLVLQMLDVPKQMPANVGEFVEGELRQYVTLSGKSIVSDFCAVGAGGVPPKRLLAAATEREKMRMLASACDAAGLRAEAVEPAVLAYARAASRDQTAGTLPGNRLIVEINGQYLAACVLRKGVLDSVRVKNIPEGADGSEGVRTWLAEEIKAMVQYYGLELAAGRGDWQVTVVVRDAAQMTPEAVDHLRAMTGITTLNVVDSSDADLESMTADDRGTPDKPSRVAWGLALRQLDSDSHTWRINLLPRDVTQARASVRHMLMATTAAAVVFLAMLVVLQFVTRTADTMRHDIERKRFARKLDTTSALVAEVNILDRRIEQASHRVRQMQEVLRTQNHVDWPSVLSAMRDEAPAEVCVTGLWSRDARDLSVKGLALSYDAAQAFVQRLDSRELFESVSLRKLERHQTNTSVVQYEIDCLL